MSRVTDINYVHDALLERLPRGWSLARESSPDGPLYRWTRWSTGQQMIVQVHEDYATALGTVDKLCDQLMDDVYDSFGDPLARNTAPISQRRQETGNA